MNRAPDPEVCARIVPYLREVTRVSIRDPFEEAEEFLATGDLMRLRGERALDGDQRDAALFEPALIAFRISPQQLLGAHLAQSIALTIAVGGLIVDARSAERLSATDGGAHFRGPQYAVRAALDAGDDLRNLIRTICSEFAQVQNLHVFPRDTFGILFGIRRFIDIGKRTLSAAGRCAHLGGPQDAAGDATDASRELVDLGTIGPHQLD